MTPKERTELIDSLLDGDISESDFLRIEAELSVDAEVRKQYYDRLILDLLLERQASDAHDATLESLLNPSPDSNGAGRYKTIILAVGVLAALAATFACVVYWLPLDPGSTGRSTTVARNQIEPTAAGFAILDGQSDAVWEGAQLTDGSLLPAGELHLKSGLAHLEFFSGVQMVVQGDAVFTVDSAMQVSMKRGRASAHVPDAAHGFRVKTNQGDVIDLGTEFALDVSEDSARIEVTAGEVELQPRGTDSQRMAEGESRELSNDGPATNRNAATLGMIRPEDFTRRLLTQQSDQCKLWQIHSESLGQDDRLVAFYQFESGKLSPRQLPNLASSDNAVASNGAIVAGERSKNRWGHAESALDFSRMGSRVRVNVPGEYRGLTLLCWVKINSLDRQFNSLFLTDGHELNEPHWQIMNDGRLFFSVKKYDENLMANQKPDKYHFYSPVIWDSSLSGKWMMIATVYDVDAKRVTSYVNGKSISTETVPDDYLVEKVRIGPASIANWSEPMYRTDPEFVVRNLNGSIDEFAIFSGALSSEEIAEHFRIGNPKQNGL